jgi:two-component system, OmpR family, sensor histidine kinase BaeS
MRLRLLHRLFLAFAALSIAALAAFVVLQQDGFRRGFLVYLDALSAELLEKGSARLAERYALYGNWDFLRGRPRLMMDALGIMVDARSEAGLDADDVARRRPRGGPFAGPRDPGRPPPRPLEGRPRPPFGPPPQHSRSLADDPLDIGGRLTLVDQNGIAVVGNPEISANARAFDVVLEGQLIGRLHLAPLPQWRGRLDEAFARSQWRRGLIGAAAIMVCALLLAWLLARWLQGPIRALAAGAQALAAGDYRTRVGSAGKDELGELVQDFNRLAQALERNQSARRQWSADIAHELRTPLAILHGEIQALQDGVRSFGPATLESLQAETTRLTALVEDLYQLALSDIGGLEYRFVELDLADLVAEALRSQQGMLVDAGIVADLSRVPPMPAPISGDPRRLAQLFGNLLANTARYTDAPGTLQIELIRDGADWRLRLDDSPPGVTEAQLPLLFDRLYRTDGSRNRASGGAGLGLAIARNIVEAHRGTITAANSPLGGLRIEIRLPVSAGASR